MPKPKSKILIEMTINLVMFASVLTKSATMIKVHEPLLSELEKNFTINIIDCQDIDKLSDDDFKLLFIASGGVERLIVQHFESLTHPVALLTDGLQNSLAASLEISAWFRSKGMRCEILHGDYNKTVERIYALYNNFKAKRSIQGQRVGVIGTPSSWLIASDVDYLLAKRRWGIDCIDIPLDTIHEKFETISDADVEASCIAFSSQALAIREASDSDLRKAMRLYRAIKLICEENNLNAVSLSCFNLIGCTKTTGCLALALLNDEGIIAGCEGDLQSLFTLMVVKALTGASGFMANPSMIKEDKNEIIFGHCTIGLHQTERFIIRNHFETQSGVAIQGLMPTGEVTIFRCGNESLDEFYVSTGNLIENTNYINMCRTQVRVKLNTPVKYFLKNPLGNHHIIIQGNWENTIKEFLVANKCKRVE